MNKKSKTLREKIRGYRRTKWVAASPLIAAGLIGIALPIIPGAPLLAAGMALMKPLDVKRRTAAQKKDNLSALGLSDK